MASILDRYGIKEVCDFTLYALDNSGKPTNPVLYLDSLKVSTMEQTAENTSARGGKGNAEYVKTCSFTKKFVSKKSSNCGKHF